MNAFEMVSLSARWSMENGPPSGRSTDAVRAAPETSSTSRYGASRRAASPRIAAIRIPVIPPGYQQIPGYEAHRQRQEARALMGSIAERRGRPTPAPILVRGDAPSLLSCRRRSLGAACAVAFAGAGAQQLPNEQTRTMFWGSFLLVLLVKMVVGFL
ncbi:hypothetical protein N7519_009979 [Penicillium mononematosum]|uniref:uncharacterized protein n=1 Tax=Penicillium mononematosum TaxID=268346 RepID=UPI0025496602|nr:uncharacterized protein N7519_009979 [Penicillium mononematosum]KAJ6179518.1 hypothetical protein N7519_009979 [Penicillium mononematosum]